MAKLLMLAGYVAWLNMPPMLVMMSMMAGDVVWLSMQAMTAG
jgi:hypothetical protein